VDDAVNGRVLGKDIIQRRLVGNVQLVEVGTAAANQLNAVEGDLGGVVEAVDNNDIIAVLEQSKGREGTNVAGSAASSDGSAQSLHALPVEEIQEETLCESKRGSDGCGLWTYPVIRTVPTAILNETLSLFSSCRQVNNGYRCRNRMLGKRTTQTELMMVETGKIGGAESWERGGAVLDRRPGPFPALSFSWRWGPGMGLGILRILVSTRIYYFTIIENVVLLRVVSSE
jgi:hypothetical protein